ncbi:hypothetical protein C4J81_13245 [Deltaproteobacteria bacterium Smac51]|nr:hypothetical protein C4J81_13245 [Deltaproteobacteria bacterium Smac51]
MLRPGVSGEMLEKRPLSPDVLICGTTVRLMALETTKSKWTTILIGARPGRYIIVEMPRVAGGPVKLDEGTMWAANFISKGSVYSFQTTVTGYTYRMVPLLFLEYPREVEIASLRTEKRYPVNIPMTMKIRTFPPEERAEDLLTPENLAGTLKALVVDLSEGGFMMASPVPLPVESTIDATFYLPREEAIANIRAVVKACRGKPGSYFVGLSYLPSTEADTAGRISDIITNIENMPLRL